VVRKPTFEGDELLRASRGETEGSQLRASRGETETERAWKEMSSSTWLAADAGALQTPKFWHMEGRGETSASAATLKSKGCASAGGWWLVLQ
jgi:hypothetical protein